VYRGFSATTTIEKTIIARLTQIKEILCTSLAHTERRCSMQNDTEAKITQDLLAEIQILEQNYRVLSGFISGTDYDPATVGNSIQSFKDSLSRASAFVLALYNLKGRRVNIPWEPLFTSLDYALATLSTSASIKQRDAVRAILAMAKDQMVQVLSYFAALKESLK
jgi:hypothetical protein